MPVCYAGCYYTNNSALTCAVINRGDGSSDVIGPGTRYRTHGANKLIFVAKIQ